MNNQLLQVKVTQRLNKLSSSDYQNIECWMTAEAFNKALDQWVTRQIEGSNPSKNTAEGSIRSIDKLNIILTEAPLTMVNSGDYWEAPLPADYNDWSRVSAKATSKDECCPPRRLKIYLGEEADLDNVMLDKNKRPSYDWAETFGTVIGGKVRIYTNDCFNLVTPFLTYYRKPRHIKIANCIDPDTNTPVTTDVLCEFPDNVIEILIDEAAAILAGDMDNYNKMQILNQNGERNN